LQRSWKSGLRRCLDDRCAAPWSCSDAARNRSGAAASPLSAVSAATVRGR
jgi:hypothetical protein